MKLLKKLFAPKSLPLRAACVDLGGRYIEGGLWRGDWIEIDHRGRTIYLQVIYDHETSTRATCFSVDLQLSEECNLMLMRNWWGQSFYGVAASLTNVTRFDCPQFAPGTVAYSKSPEFAKRILDDHKVIELVSENSGLVVGLARRSTLLKGTYGREFFVVVKGVETQIEVLRSLLQLTLHILEMLAEMGEVGLTESSLPSSAACNEPRH